MTMGSSIALMPSWVQSCEYFMESGWDNVELYYVNQENVNFFFFFFPHFVASYKYKSFK